MDTREGSRNVESNPYFAALQIGFVAGSRALVAPAATLAAEDSIWTGLAALAAVGELVIDKLPFTPSRLAPPLFLARVVAGAYCGSSVAARRYGSRAGGAVLGVAGAIAAALLGSRVRSFAADRDWPDFPVALAEDAICLSTAWSVTAG